MPIPAFPVFVSSTWKDLGPERAAAEAVVQRLRETKFVGMEYFGSRDETTRRASLDEVDRSAVYVGIIAARYGSGITEDEYRRARECDLPCFIYFKDDSAIPDELRETDPAKTARLGALKAELKREHTVNTFTSPDNLAAKLTADLHRWLSDNPAASAQSTARHQLRAPVGDFVGRAKEIAGLTAALRGGGAAIIGISGMGGIGKTELSLYIAGRLRDAYPDAQLVLDMHGTNNTPRDPADALASCIRAFVGLEKKLPDGLEELTRLYRSALEGKRSLVLLDNASDSTQVSPLMPPAGSALIVTSRGVIALPGMQRLTLEQLQPAEARELLTSIAPHAASGIADQICYLCGYLPLAVRAAGSLLGTTPDLDPARYALELSDERTRLERIGEDPMIGIGVEASFGLSYARLSPDAARVFRLLAVFPATFDAPAEEAICQDPGHQHLTDLLRRSLVLYNPDTRRYRLHDLARLFADSRLSADERIAVRLRHAIHYVEILSECQELYKQGGKSIASSLKLFDTERRNIEAGQKWAGGRVGGDEVGALLCNAYGVGNNVLELRQHPRERVAWLEAGVASARQLEDRESEGKHLGNMGRAYAALGETLRAIELYEQSLAITREVGDREGEVCNLGDLGGAYQILGETRRAIELYEQGLAIAREVGDRRAEGGLLGSLGVAHTSLGETHRAIEFHEQDLTTARATGDRRGEARALGNLGVAYAMSGELNRAIDLFRQQLEIARELGDLRGEGRSLFNIAWALGELGNLAQAIASAEAALEPLERVESPDAKVVRELLAEWRGEA